MSENTRQRALLAFVLMLSLGIWIGGSVAVAAIAVPTAFDRAVMSRDYAADFGAALFPKVNLMEGVLGAVGILTAGLMGRTGWGTKIRHRTATALLMAMTALVLVFLFVLTPAISARVEELRAAGIDLDDMTRMPPERETLRTMHTTYVGLDVAKILAGVAVLWLLATRQK